MAITKDQIFAAADTLVAEGTGATLAAVRKVVGGGSFTTISEALKEWRASHQEATIALQEPAPQALHDQLAGVVTAAWAMALELANARLASERESLERVRIELEQSRAEAVDLADQLSAELEQRDAAAITSDQELERRAGEVTRLTGQLAHASESAHVAQAALTEAHARIEQLTGLLDREQAARADAVDRAAVDRQESTQLASELVESKRRATAAEAQVAAAQQATEQATRELSNQTKIVLASHARFESAERELTATKKTAAEARAAATRAGEEAAELRGIVMTLREQLAHAKGPD